MTDRISSAHRSWNMSRIKSKETTIEVLVRRFLFHRGFRYRKNVRGLPGTPDIVLRKYKTVIFINGCFWHMHKNCKESVVPKTRTEFWLTKLTKNVKNDEKHYRELRQQGWKVIVIWECQLDRTNYEQTMEKLVNKIIDCR